MKIDLFYYVKMKFRKNIYKLFSVIPYSNKSILSSDSIDEI